MSISNLIKILVLNYLILALLVCATSVVANEDLFSWDFEVIQIDGTVHKGKVYLNRAGDLVGTLYDLENVEFVQAYGWPSESSEDMVGINMKLFQL